MTTKTRRTQRDEKGMEVTFPTGSGRGARVN
jgi:hypothetical protein